MRKYAFVFLALVALSLIAPAAFAQASDKGAKDMSAWSAFGMAIAAAGCGIAQSRIASSACEGMARNPGASAAIRAAMILGLVFVETLALFTLVIIFAKV
jgi:F-type H+-transporting ATPase subunit c